MPRTRCALISSGLCLAAAISLPGCAAERTSRPAFAWTRSWFPSRADRIAEQGPDNSADTLAPPAAPPTEWTPSDPNDDYFSPRSREFARPERTSPPLAPPAEPGYFADDSDTATQSTSGRTHQDGRPARLRDVFETWGRKQPADVRPTIPLDEPVAELHHGSGLQFVDFQQVEPVVLGEPVFEAAD